MTVPATLVDLLLLGGEQGARTAHVYRTGVRRLTFSFEDTIRHAQTVAAMLQERGVKPGDHVMLLGPNDPAWVWSFFGILLAGGVVVPADMRAQREVTEAIAKDAGVTLLIRTGLKPELPGVPSLVLEDLFAELLAGVSNMPAIRNRPAPDDLAELVYTSGTTGKPKGVMLTHRNILSNILAVEQVVAIHQDQSTVSVLPLSHIFEQVIGFLIFWRHGASVVYLRTVKPSEIFAAIEEERPTNLILVPRLLMLLRTRIEHEVRAKHLGSLFATLLGVAGHVPRWVRRLLFIAVHRKFGLSFRYFVAGGAPLLDDLHRFWEALGFTVVQGYGLTETSPILACNTPEEQRIGSVGRLLPGQEVTVSVEGEVLARGPNVSQGYYKDPEKTAAAFADGWFRTGDLGELRGGWLYLKGRQKDVIVPAHGMNVYAEDVEAVVSKVSGVRDVAVLGKKGRTGEEVHAVLLLEPGSPPPAEIVKVANARLDSTQQISGATVWPQEDFPRTATMKIRKFLVAQALERQGSAEEPRVPAVPTKHERLFVLIAEAANRPLEQVRQDAVLATDLGLDSVGRLELVSLLETELAADIEESEITAGTTVADLERLLAGAPRARRAFFWRWPFAVWMSPVQWLLRRLLAFPLLRVWVRVETNGREHLTGLTGPVLFVSNHVSAIDTLVLLRALRGPLRRVAVFARSDLFEHKAFFRALVWRSWFFLFSLFVPVIVVPQDRGFRRTLAFAGRYADRGRSFILFPEGQRTDDGRLRLFRTGAGVAAQELLLPVVPVRLVGLFALLPRTSKWPRRGRARVVFGKPFRVPAGSPVGVTRVLQRAVEELAAAS